MAIDFDDTQYRFSHGRAPRGRGAWWFATDPRAGATDDAKIIRTPSLPYRDAKVWAKAAARERFGKDAAGTLFVMP